TMWMQVGHLSLSGLAGAMAIGSLASAVLMVNNLRDIPTDTEAGKITLAVRQDHAGRAAGRQRCPHRLCGAGAAAVRAAGPGDPRWASGGGTGDPRSGAGPQPAQDGSQRHV